MSRASTDPAGGRAERPCEHGERATAVLSRSTLMTVRRVLHAYRDGWLLEERLATAARMAAEDARRLGLPAERMLVALKRAWAQVDDVRRLPALEARDLLNRLVTPGIRAYYEPAGARRSAGPAGARPATGGHTDERGHADGRAAA